ncbi:hypothetical protein HYY69_07690 [Candidatus Woesearchaeota archaeon]|nr:hypothetical protein [Candidatus Woesearchaeota archaeon]
MFIRIKKIKQFYYAYAVVNQWTKKGARQKVVGYLGRVVTLEPKESKSEFPEEKSFNDFVDQDLEVYLENTGAKDIVKKYIMYELYKHGFSPVKENNNLWQYQDIILDFNTGAIQKQGSKVVLQLNNDFLCENTLKNLLNFRSEADEELCGKELAQAFISAGIPVQSEVFIDVFRKIFKPGDISYMR